MTETRYFRLEDGRILGLAEDSLYDGKEYHFSAKFSVTSATGDMLIYPTYLDQATEDGSRAVVHFDVNDDGGFTFYRQGYSRIFGQDFDPTVSQYSEETFDATGQVTAALERSDVVYLFGDGLTGYTNQAGWIEQPSGTFYANGSINWTSDAPESDQYEDTARGIQSHAYNSFGFDGDTFIDTTKGALVAGFHQTYTRYGPSPEALEVTFISNAVTLGNSEAYQPGTVNTYRSTIDLTSSLLAEGQIFKGYQNGGGQEDQYHNVDTLKLNDGRIVVVWSGNIQDATTGSIHDKGLYRAVISEDGDILSPAMRLSVSGQETVYWPELHLLQDGTYAISFQDGSQTYSAGDDTYVQRYSIEGNLIGTIRVEDADARAIFVSPDGTVFDIAMGEAGSYGTTYSTFDNVGPTLEQPRDLTGTAAGDVLQGGSLNDRLNGLAGNDTLYGADGADTLIGGTGDDFLYGGSSTTDLRDVIYGGDGNDSIDGGYGNDELRGDAGNDTIAGGFGADTVIGGTGDDVITGQAYGDLLYGGDGDDFINGGFGFDRVNGGAGADKFYHLGVYDHGSDWIQDYNAADGDVLRFGGDADTAATDFLIQRAVTEGAGAANVAEIFVTQISTGTLLWALVDGDAQAEINIQIGAQVFDLLA